MMAAVAIGAYPDMEACVAEWVTPLLGQAEAPDPELSRIYGSLYPAYAQAREALEPVWDRLAEHRAASGPTAAAADQPEIAPGAELERAAQGGS